MRNHVGIFFTEPRRKLAGAVVVRLQSLRTNYGQGVPQLGPELRLAPLQDDGGVQHGDHGWIRQGCILTPEQNKNQFLVFLLR